MLVLARTGANKGLKPLEGLEVVIPKKLSVLPKKCPPRIIDDWYFLADTKSWIAIMICSPIIVFQDYNWI